MYFLTELHQQFHLKNPKHKIWCCVIPKALNWFILLPYNFRFCLALWIRGQFKIISYNKRLIYLPFVADDFIYAVHWAGPYDNLIVRAGPTLDMEVPSEFYEEDISGWEVKEYFFVVKYPWN